MVSRLFEQCKGVGTEVPVLLFSCIPKTSRADVVMHGADGAQQVGWMDAAGWHFRRAAYTDRSGTEVGPEIWTEC